MFLWFFFKLSACRLKQYIGGDFDAAFPNQEYGLSVFHSLADGTYDKEIYKILTWNVAGVDRVIESIPERGLCFI